MTGYTVADFQVGDEIRFWSERVFGVPVHAKVLRVGRKRLAVEAGAMGKGRAMEAVWVTWPASILPGQVVDIG